MGEERREQILAAFENCVVRNGIEKTTLEDIAQEAGQPRSLVRYFVGNRDELTALLIERLVRRTADRLAGIHASGEGSTAKFAQAFFDEFFADELSNRIVIELWHMAIRSPELKARLFALYDGILQVVADELTRARPTMDARTAFDATYATFALGLGSAILAGIGLAPSDPQRLLTVAQGLASGQALMSPAGENTTI